MFLIYFLFSLSLSLSTLSPFLIWLPLLSLFLLSNMHVSGWVLTLIEQRLAKIAVMCFDLVSTDLLVAGYWFNGGFMLFTVVELYGLGFDFGGCWLNGFWLLLLIMAWWWWLRFGGLVDLDFNGWWSMGWLGYEFEWWMEGSEWIVMGLDGWERERERERERG